MKLIATPKSHFSRKVRLLLDHLELSYEMLDVGNVADNTPARFFGNPLMSVPILEDGAVWMLESDHIARYLVSEYNHDDTYKVLTNSIDDLNARAVMNGIMANEVKIILAARTGLDPARHAYFQKARSAIEQGLAWLELRTHLFHTGSISYSDFHLISLWDHLSLYGLIDLDYPSLHLVAKAISSQQKVQRSTPPRD